MYRNDEKIYFNDVKLTIPHFTIKKQYPFQFLLNFFISLSCLFNGETRQASVENRLRRGHKTEKESNEMENSK